MNTKKITALVLAAMMAAGTTSTAFAAATATRPLDVIPTEGFYVEDDGVLVLDADQQVAPGTTVYLRLDEMPNGTYGSNKVETKDKERFKVYADWKVGEDAVESMDIVYRKGFQASAGVKNYTVKIGDKTLTVANATTADVVAAINAAIVDDPTFLQDEVNKFLEENSVKTGFAIVAGKSEDTVYTLVTTEDGYKSADEGFVVNKKYAATGEKAETVSSGYIDSVMEDGTNAANDFYLEAGQDDFGKVSFEAGDDSEFASTPATKGDYYLTALEGEGVYFIKKASVSKITVDQLATIDLAEEVTAPVIYKDADKSVVEGEILSDTNPAYVIDDVVYVDFAKAEAEATKAVVEEVAAKAMTQPLAVNVDTDIDVNYNAGYTYWIQIDTKEDYTTKLLDLAGTVTIGTSRTDADKYSSSYNLDTTLSNRVNPYTVLDDITIEPDANGAVKFDSEAEDVVIYFSENGLGRYEFDARGQSALNFEYTVKFNKEIADLFYNANLDFIDWKADPATNRTGTLYVAAPADSFIYELTENGIKEVAGAKYNEDEEAWEIRTRQLTGYVISDRELDTDLTLDGETSSESSTTTDGTKPNPSTGR